MFDLGEITLGILCRDRQAKKAKIIHCGDWRAASAFASSPASGRAVKAVAATT
jgi:hypothetical protein